mmetsp:Transcript_22959/g.74805  ORF Transcript_22959/g.74805 Transcript_22959/m.74805 type:complete len:202 (-) Transcript_22959:74-679(-)
MLGRYWSARCATHWEAWRARAQRCVRDFATGCTRRVQMTSSRWMRARSAWSRAAHVTQSAAGGASGYREARRCARWRVSERSSPARRNGASTGKPQWRTIRTRGASAARAAPRPRGRGCSRGCPPLSRRVGGCSCPWASSSRARATCDGRLTSRRCSRCGCSRARERRRSASSHSTRQGASSRRTSTPLAPGSDETIRRTD